ncbi:MAG: UTP--glucose-1-phosphate uridylyltransferase GalU [candidate division KSB1 bacterium]|nr:UTP--glucose-1-phosphate uridylyltransferase GalU [candidate division KSB1 bacterium]MDZ7358021.1 UTP--glucose-1-phosphate uridylyltransferase GalU [candidate division KSB1 bacterium]MDZ7375751.1 UTP--glucose-1-phosphate uridylyltransferase GalU [candidate division KSB1 bacterium]MDZ7399422.1 UTP--glucose-1-phosphate uridylyltransferase GalU [candidate division KSB1 bacterium]
MVRKAVIPAAGLGTRFLPATKAQPKEMLPIIDTPTIQYVVQEAVDSGIDDILIISGKGKRAIEDHFDRNFELEARLGNNNDRTLYNEIRHIADMANIHFIRQKELNGLGDAIYQARLHTGNEPFAVLLGDTIVDSVIPVTQQLIDVYNQFRATIIAVEPVPSEKVSRYGIIGGKMLSDSIWEVTELVEKPDPERSPSNLAIAGRYILTPEIYKAIEQTPPGKNNEIQLTDAMRLMLRRENIYANIIEGKRYDIGNKLDYLKTTVEFALKRKEFAAEFRKFLLEIVNCMADEDDAL